MICYCCLFNEEETITQVMHNNIQLTITANNINASAEVPQNKSPIPLLNVPETPPIIYRVTARIPKKADQSLSNFMDFSLPL